MIRGGKRYERWATDRQRDIDALLHWQVDVMRAREHLALVLEVLQAAEQQLRLGRPTGMLMEGAFISIAKAQGKTQGVHQNMHKRRTTNGGSFNDTDGPVKLTIAK